MHEMAITQGIVELCSAKAAGRHVISVVVEIGELSGVVAEAVEFAFDVCTSGTILEGARLVVERIPGTGTCPSCGSSSPIASYFDPCPSCGAYGLSVTSGEELRVKELEVE